jgi:hypothetical protein
MSDLPSRASPPEVVERKRLRAIARPFAKDIMKWQAKLAVCRQGRDASKATVEDAVVFGSGLGDLLAEVQEAQARFRQATAGEPMAGALDDVSRALERLIEQISAELR